MYTITGGGKLTVLPVLLLSMKNLSQTEYTVILNCISKWFPATLEKKTRYG